MSDHIVFWLRHFAMPITADVQHEDWSERWRRNWRKGRQKAKARRAERKRARKFA